MAAVEVGAGAEARTKAVQGSVDAPIAPTQTYDSPYEKDRETEREYAEDEADYGKKRNPRERKRGKRLGQKDFADFASGANSVEVNMAARVGRHDGQSGSNEAHGISQKSPLPGFSATTGQSSSQAAHDSHSNGASTTERPYSQSGNGHDTSMTHDSTNPPPSGPAMGGKFSFAFKATKTTATIPKPEISQKFNAPLAPKAKTAQQPPTGPSRTTDPRDRAASDPRDRNRDAPPRNAPTEPASARVARSNQQPRPRTRKVIKKFRKLLPKKELPEHLASSQSVYYRKPGNESVVGSGTYGKVFKAKNVYTGVLVALKRIRMEGERDGFPVTAMREIKLLQYLRHRNVVELMEVMVERNECFMVFEYLAHDLTGILNHPSFKLNDAQKKDMSKQMFEGLDYLHSRGVLHRDIKAANILVSKEGVLKLADFGLARFFAKRHQQDYTNRVITIWYRSPELLLGETKYTASVDVWSAACVMVEIFCQQPIFPGDGTEASQLECIFSVMGTATQDTWPQIRGLPWFQLLRPRVIKPSTFVGRYRDKVSPQALDLLKTMFEYDPSKRPTAAEVLAHGYFTEEEPAPAQCTALKDLDGDWHEFESKALRREARRARETHDAHSHPLSSRPCAHAASASDGPRPDPSGSDSNGFGHAGPALEQAALHGVPSGGLSSEEMQLDTTDNSGEVIASSDLSSGSSAPVRVRSVGTGTRTETGTGVPIRQSLGAEEGR
ncbi:hypothetical protein TD95_002182 [Thielaviopsis punctulata]|uniref:cyclin-dependent kinase n=1 Tax=Thielaviopsis punctulata TaxID=72032 RepID=A0A0F4ZFZ7_9PEZI|nr:hypothetical protein TD95_002182 [Thielaviopsis punctulata]